MTTNNDLNNSFSGVCVEKLATFLFQLSDEYEWSIFHFSEIEKNSNSCKYFFMFYSTQAASLIVIETKLICKPFGLPKKYHNFYVHPNTHKVVQVWSKELLLFDDIEFEILLRHSNPLFQSYEKSEE
jgi:hypothetical protein